MPARPADTPPDTHLAEACEEPVHHRRLPVDGVSHAVPFGHPVTEKAQAQLDQDAGRSGPFRHLREQLGASFPRTARRPGASP